MHWHISEKTCMLISSDAWTHLAWCIGLILVHFVLACTVFRPMTWCACYIEKINFYILYIHSIRSIPIYYFDITVPCLVLISKGLVIQKQVKNNAGKKKKKFGCHLDAIFKFKMLAGKLSKQFFWLMISIYEIRKSHAKSFARIESDWTFRECVFFRRQTL